MVNIVIVGTGDLAYALAHLYHLNNRADSGHLLEVTKESIKESGKTFHETDVPLRPIDEALEHADVVLLAIPAWALSIFVSDYIDALKHTILVDCTNSSRKGEDLDSLVTSTEICFVKAFNDLGAVNILAHKTVSKTKFITNMCSPNAHALNVVRRIAETSLGLDVKVVPYGRYGDLANSQNTIGKEWIRSIRIMLTTFALTETYAVLRYNVFKGYAWYHLPIQVTNKAVCWTAITGFALTLLPGVVARLGNLFRSDNTVELSPTLKGALNLRKHLGLVALWFLGVHVFMSLLIMSPAYYSKFYIDPKASTSQLNAIGETSFLFAIFGAMLYTILGIASLPSVGAVMNNAQWALVYGPLPWVALAFGTSHVMIMGVQQQGWTNTEAWPGGMPTITLASVVIPLLVMLLKIVEVILTLAGRKAPKVKGDTLEAIRSDIREKSKEANGHESERTHESNDESNFSGTLSGASRGASPLPYIRSKAYATANGNVELDESS